jgi:hypothetical protein
MGPADSILYALVTPSRRVATKYLTNSVGEDSQPSGLREMECMLLYCTLIRPTGSCLQMRPQIRVVGVN